MSIEMLNKSLGMYRPAFFYIKMGVPMDFENLINYDTPQRLGIFFCKYIHYLQDISTTFGIMNTHILLERLNTYIFNVVNQRDREVKRPIRLKNIKMQI